jgi:hypothetical protein
MDELQTFIAGAAIGGLLSWLVTHRYYVKAGKDQATALTKLKEDLRPRTTLRDFEDMLARSIWTKAVIDHTEVWMADEDNTFQMQRGERSRDFTERWTKAHPDPNSASYPIYLKIAGTVVKELTFISVDGGRIFVPMPEARPLADGTANYFWNLGSLEVRVCRVVGEYYRYNDLEGVARRSSVSIVE